MVSAFIRATPAEEDLLVAALWEAGTAGITEQAGGIRAFFSAESDLRRALQDIGREPAEIRTEQDTDWVQVTQDSFPPLVVGERFYLAPPWDQSATPPGRLRLEITPGMACGTGYHPCTQLCLEAMERYLVAGSSVLDVGSGSGILSTAATLLNAGQVIGCDIDPDTRPMFVGSVDAIRSNSIDLIVANISAAAIDQLWLEFVRVQSANSTLILSGFQTFELEPSWNFSEMTVKADWACIAVRNP